MATKKTATSTAVATVKKTSTAVVSIQARIAALAEANKEKVGADGGNAIRVTQDKNFVVPGAGEMAEFDAVIVDFLSTQDYYAGKFDPKNISPPACFAIGTDPKNLVPSDNSPDKQAKTCNECPNFQWGSDGDGKLCKSGRKLALLPEDADKDTPMQTLKLSPTAIKGFDGFIKGLTRIGSIPAAHVVHFDFNPAVSHAQVRVTEPRPNAAAETALDRMDEAASLLKVEPDVSSYGQKKAAPARGGAARRK